MDLQFMPQAVPWRSADYSFQLPCIDYGQTQQQFNYMKALEKENFPAQLQCVDYETSQKQVDHTSAPERQARVALDNAISSGNIDMLRIVLQQIVQHIPHQTILLMKHALKCAATKGNLDMVQFLLDQSKSNDLQDVFGLMRHALDGAATHTSPDVLSFLLGLGQRAFAAYPEQFLQLVQYAVNSTAKQGNLGLLKFLMDHTAAAAIPVNYDDVFNQAATRGQAEMLLQEAIRCGAEYENVIMMFLQSIKNLPKSGDSRLGSRQSLKNTAKVQVVKTYKRSNPTLFTKLMAAMKNYFPEDITSHVDADVSM